jgi:hypothetical protein
LIDPGFFVVDLLAGIGVRVREMIAGRGVIKQVGRGRSVHYVLE